jgi:hypothetical protein
MPIYEVRRSYTELAQVAVHDTVFVDAGSREKAIERAEEDDIGDTKHSETGHTEYTGNKVSEIDVRSAEQVAERR